MVTASGGVPGVAGGEGERWTVQDGGEATRPATDGGADCRAAAVFPGVSVVRRRPVISRLRTGVRPGGLWVRCSTTDMVKWYGKEWVMTSKTMCRRFRSRVAGWCTHQSRLRGSRAASPRWVTVLRGCEDRESIKRCRNILPKGEEAPGIQCIRYTYRTVIRSVRSTDRTIMQCHTIKITTVIQFIRHTDETYDSLGGIMTHNQTQVHTRQCFKHWIHLVCMLGASTSRSFSAHTGY